MKRKSSQTTLALIVFEFIVVGRYVISVIFLGERTSRRQLRVAVSRSYPKVMSLTAGVLRGSFVSEDTWSRRQRCFYQGRIILGRLLPTYVDDRVLFDSVAVVCAVLLFLLFWVVFSWRFNAAEKFTPVFAHSLLLPRTRWLLLAHLYVVKLLLELGRPDAFFTWRTRRVPIWEGALFWVPDFLSTEQLHPNLTQFMCSFCIFSLFILKRVSRIFNLVVIIVELCLVGHAFFRKEVLTYLSLHCLIPKPFVLWWLLRIATQRHVHNVVVHFFLLFAISLLFTFAIRLSLIG